MKKTSRKILIGLGWSLAAIITMLFLWGAWENWTGAREWENVRERLVKADVELELKKLLPEQPEQEENFFSTPSLLSLTEFSGGVSKSLAEDNVGAIVYTYPEEREQFLKMSFPKDIERHFFPSWSAGRKANLHALEKFLQTDSILSWMKPFESELAVINEAAKRPHSVMNIKFGTTFPEMISMPLPSLTELRDFQQFQTIRACAALRAGDHKLAIETLQSMFQLAKGSTSNRTIIGFLVSNVLFENCASVIWEGMDSEQWTAEDLVWIQDEIAKFDILSDFEDAITLEMVAFQIGGVDYLKQVGIGEAGGLVRSIGSGMNVSAFGWLAVAAPEGVWNHNKAIGCRIMFEEIIEPVRKRQMPSDKGIVEALKHRNHRNFLPSITVPAVPSMTRKAYQYYTTIDLIRIAAALERYHLAENSYPDSIADLVPRFIDQIPSDIFSPNLTPLSYSKDLRNDRYRVYSLGRNGTDEKGEVVFKTKVLLDDTQGDIVWAYGPER